MEISAMSRKKMLASDPIQLANIIRNSLDYTIPENLNDSSALAEALTKTTGYIAFFSEMETVAKLYKRQMKTIKDKEEAERFLGLEEVFGMYRKIYEQNYNLLSRTITLKKLEFEETRIMGKQI